MTDLETIAAHLKSVGKRASFAVWVADNGFACRIDCAGLHRRVPGSSPVFFCASMPEAIATAAEFCRSGK